MSFCTNHQHLSVWRSQPAGGDGRRLNLHLHIQNLSGVQASDENRCSFPVLLLPPKPVWGLEMRLRSLGTSLTAPGPRSRPGRAGAGLTCCTFRDPPGLPKALCWGLCFSWGFSAKCWGSVLEQTYLRRSFAKTPLGIQMTACEVTVFCFLIHLTGKGEQLFSAPTGVPLLE